MGLRWLMRGLSILAALLLHVGASAELLHDEVVLSFCRVLSKKAIVERHIEQGAFVVQTAGGLQYFVAWPPTEERDVARWYGHFPDGTVAIVHTHPPHLPEPSKLDIAVARRARVPVYVITPSRISKTTGGAPEVVTDGDWIIGQPSR